jgi:hypothetical protein
MENLIIYGEKYPPYKGTYYRLLNEDNQKHVAIFNHLYDDLDSNIDVFGIKGSELSYFTYLAEIHGFKVIIAYTKD